MTMFPKLGYPAKQPKWGTNATYRVEPPEADKILGHSAGESSPAYWENWRTYFVYLWTQKIASTLGNNWNQGADISANANRAAIFNPSLGYWLVTEASSTPYYSTDGHTWASGNTLGATPASKSIGIDGSYYLVGVGSDIKYSADAGKTAWSTKTPGIGGSGSINRIHTKYPDTDYILIVQGGGTTVATGYSSSGVTGTFTRSTTDPAMVAGAVAQDLIYLGGTTWLLSAGDKSAVANSGLFKSVDDGVNWTSITSNLPPVAGQGIYSMAYNSDLGRLIITGDDNTAPYKDEIWYSDDIGATWTAATIDYKGLGATSANTRVDPIYYCGGGLWVGAMEPTELTSDGTIRFLIVSTDNGETWGVPDVNGVSFSASGDTLNYFACDERKIMVFGDDGLNISSLSS